MSNNYLHTTYWEPMSKKRYRALYLLPKRLPNYFSCKGRFSYKGNVNLFLSCFFKIGRPQDQQVNTNEHKGCQPYDLWPWHGLWDWRDIFLNISWWQKHLKIQGARPSCVCLFARVEDPEPFFCQTAMTKSSGSQVLGAGAAHLVKKDTYSVGNCKQSLVFQALAAEEFVAPLLCCG